MSIRFRTRSIHETITEEVERALGLLGWITTPVNFGVVPVRVVDFQPEDRAERIEVNTVAVTLGDTPVDVDEELGAAVGGLRSVNYPVYLDAYMSDTPVSIAICDDLVEHFTDLAVPVKDVINGGTVDGVTLVMEDVAGPRRPPAASGGEAFKKHWRVVELTGVLYFNT